nr:MAG TPA: hypothetical protein [Caudoviricetes sp.]
MHRMAFYQLFRLESRCNSKQAHFGVGAGIRPHPVKVSARLVFFHPDESSGFVCKAPRFHDLQCIRDGRESCPHEQRAPLPPPPQAGEQATRKCPRRPSCDNAAPHSRGSWDQCHAGDSSTAGLHKSRRTSYRENPFLSSTVVGFHIPSGVGITARSSQYSLAPTLRGSFPKNSFHEGRFSLTASKCSSHFSQAATASSSALPSRQVQRIRPAPSDCSSLAAAMTGRKGSPIAGYLFSHKHPSKSIAIAFCIPLDSSCLVESNGILLDDGYPALVFRRIRIPTVQCSPGVRFMTPAIWVCRFHAIAGKTIKAVCYCVFMSFCYCELRIASISYAQARSAAKSLVPCCQHRIYRIARILCFFKYRLVLMRRQRCRKLLLNECSFAAAFTSTTNFHGVGFMLPPPPLGFDATIRSCHE